MPEQTLKRGDLRQRGQDISTGNILVPIAPVGLVNTVGVAIIGQPKSLCQFACQHGLGIARAQSGNIFNGEFFLGNIDHQIKYCFFFLIQKVSKILPQQTFNFNWPAP